MSRTNSALNLPPLPCPSRMVSLAGSGVGQQSCTVISAGVSTGVFVDTIFSYYSNIESNCWLAFDSQDFVIPSEARDLHFRGGLQIPRFARDDPSCPASRMCYPAPDFLLHHRMAPVVVVRRTCTLTRNHRRSQGIL